MRRLITVAIFCLLLPCTARSYAAQGPTDNFVFLEVSNIRQTAGGAAEPLRELAEQAAHMNPKPAFIIATGNLTETGQPEEYARIRQATAALESTGIRFYAVPGARDVHWSADGKEGFTKEFGKLYQSFDYGRAHFLLLDSTIALQPWGHFDKAELEWLKKDLARLKPETPIFLFTYHTLGRESPGKRPVDDDFELLPLLKAHNVVAIFTGDGREDSDWKTNGIPTLSSRGLDAGSRYQMSMTPLLADIDRIVKEKPGAPVRVVGLPLSGSSKPSQLRAGWDDPDIPYLERRRPAATLDPRMLTDNPDKETCEYRIDDSGWKPMQNDRREIWRDQFLTAGIDIGIHTADIRLTTSNGVAYGDELIFEIERTNTEPTRRWATDLEGPIQSSPLLSGDTLYVTDITGRLTALSTEKGKRKWFYATKGAVLSSPVLAGGVLYFGSSDHFVYAIDAVTGKFRWRFDAGGPVLATPAVAKGVVCIGCNGQIVGIDAAKGVQVWVHPTGGFFQSAAATDGDAFYLGGWDNTLYALDAATGMPRWTAPMGAARGEAAATAFFNSPAISSPSISGNRLFICSGDGLLHAVNTQTGHDIWAIHAPADGDAFGSGSPVAHDDTVYVNGVGAHGDIYAVAANNGAITWRAATGRTMYDGGPRFAPDGKSFAIMAFRGRVSVFDAASGKRIWGYELGPGNVVSTPGYDGHAVYTVTMENDVQAIDGPMAAAPSRPSPPPVKAP